jgi:ribosomal-protein-alanine N-acetyltransferase
MVRDPASFHRLAGAMPILRPVGPFDLELLAEMHAASFRESWDRPWSRQSFAEILAMPGSTGVIAALAGRDPAQVGQEGTAAPVGFGLTLAAGDEVELLLLSVLPAWRRRGFAGHLLRDLLARAAAAGAGRALLEVAATNPAAIACYEVAGFTACGRRKDYYAPGIDAVVYERILSGGSIRVKSNEEPGNRCE